MTFDSQERSVQDGEPIELFKFEGPTSTYEYFYTSNGRAVTYLGDVYVPTPQIATTVATNATLEYPEISIDVPVSTQLAIDYAFSIAPRTLKLTIFRMQGFGGPTIQWWEGIIDGITVTGNIAKFRLVFRLGDGLQTPTPRPIYQRQCNHRLYDLKCTLIPTDFDVVTTVSSISANGDIVVASVGGEPNQSFRHGEMVRSSDGERRLITDQIGTTLKISKPFKVLNATDGISIFQGCDHLPQTCSTKFSNMINYGGFPYIPTKNVWAVGLRGI